MDKVQPGSTFQIAIVMTFDEGWHANANPAGEGLIPTQVVLPKHTDLQFGEVVYPKGDVLEIASIGKAPVYHDQAVIGVQATLGQNAQLQKTELPFKLTYQACSDEQCLLPKTVGVNIPMEIVGTDQTVKPINAEIFSSLQLDMPQDTLTATSETGGVPPSIITRLFLGVSACFHRRHIDKPDTVCLSTNSNHGQYLWRQPRSKPPEVVPSFGYLCYGYCRNVFNLGSRCRIDRCGVWTDHGEPDCRGVCVRHPYSTRTVAHRSFRT